MLVFGSVCLWIKDSFLNAWVAGVASVPVTQFSAEIKIEGD